MLNLMGFCLSASSFLCLVFNYLCIAAIARHLYMRPGAGVGSLRDAFGSKHRNGVRHAYHDHVMNYTIVE